MLIFRIKVNKTTTKFWV